jgi:hypothetical protein
MGSNKIGATGAAALAAVVELSKTMTSLSLRTNCIGDEGASVLAMSLARTSDKTIDAVCEAAILEGVAEELSDLSAPAWGG